MFVEALQRILQAEVTPEYVRKVEAGSAMGRGWDVLEEAGYLELLVPEAQGGAGLSLSDLYGIFHLLGAHATPLPLADTIIARVLTATPASLPSGPIALASSSVALPDGGVRCANVSFGAVAGHVLAPRGLGLVLLPVASASCSAAGLWGSQLASFDWPADVCVPISGSGAELSAFVATSYAAMLCGAMEQVFRLTMQYCNDRVQFGKPLGKFQAVQHQLAVMAEHIVAASLATQVAFSGDRLVPDMILAAIAKGRASEAALLVANTAHALHGAIGITAEYDLQLFTRRLHEWRITHGSETYWYRRVGECALGQQASFCEFVQAI